MTPPALLLLLLLLLGLHVTQAVFGALLVLLLPSAVPDSLPPRTPPVPASGADRVGIREGVAHGVGDVVAAAASVGLKLPRLRGPGLKLPSDGLAGGVPPPSRLGRCLGRGAELRTAAHSCAHVRVLVEPRGEKLIRVALLRGSRLEFRLHRLAIRGDGAEASAPRGGRTKVSTGSVFPGFRGRDSELRRPQGRHRVGLVLAGQVQGTRRGLGGVSQGVEIVLVRKLDVLDRLRAHVGPGARGQGGGGRIRG